MSKTKYSWGVFMGRGNKWEKADGENARMLPMMEERKKKEKNKRWKLKKVVSKFLKDVASEKEAAGKKAESENVAENLLEKATNRKEAEEEMPAEETICGFIEQGQFFQACNCISHLEHSGDDGVGKSESLYTLLAERMWSAVGEALGGSDEMFLQPLQAVGASLRWQKQKEEEWLGRKQGLEPVSTWHPNFWRKDLEEKLTQYLTAQIPHFIPTSNTDETALKQHLSQLETTLLPSLEHRSGFFKEAGLLGTYTQCCRASLSSHLSAFADSEHCTFSQGLLVYEWCLKAHKRGSGTCLGPEQSSQHVDVWIVLKIEEKILAIAQQEVGEALNEAFKIGKTPCADAAVIQILTEKTEAARHVSKRLSEKVEAVCLEECLSFLESYENEVRSSLQFDGCHGICSSLQILETCCILRTAWYKLTYVCSASTGQDVKAQGFLDRMENTIMKHFLQTVTSEVKGTLKDHFKKFDIGFKYILESLKQGFLAFGKKKTGTYEALVESVNNIIISEYVQALLTASRKTSSVQKRRRIVSKIEGDHRMLHTTFEECLGPTACALKDPVKAILELIQTSDSEGMKIALLPILKEFPDLREEHLNAMLDMKDSLSREDRAALLKIFHDNCREAETNLRFPDMEVKPRNCGLCGCFCC